MQNYVALGHSLCLVSCQKLYSRRTFLCRLEEKVNRFGSFLSSSIFYIKLVCVQPKVGGIFVRGLSDGYGWIDLEFRKDQEYIYFMGTPMIISMCFKRNKKINIPPNFFFLLIGIKSDNTKRFGAAAYFTRLPLRNLQVK